MTNEDVEERSLFPSPRSRRLIRVVLTIFLILAVSAGILYAKRSAMRKYANEWSAERHLAKADEALATGEPGVAMRRAMSAHQLDPEGIEVWRTLFSAARATGDSRLLVVAREFFDHEEATAGDRLSVIGAIVDLGNAALAEAMFALLSEEVRNTPDAIYESLRVKLLQGKGAEVIAAMDEGGAATEGFRFQVLKLDALYQDRTPASDVAAGKLALTLLEKASGDGDGSTAERRTLNERLALQLPERFDREQSVALLKAVEARPPASGEGLSVTLPFTLRIAGDPAGRDLVIEEAATALKGENRDFEALCLWMTRLGATDAILAYVGEIDAYRSPIAYRTRVGALIAAERIEDAFNHLQFPPREGEKVDLHLMEASLAKRMARGSSEIEAWNKAMLAAEADLTRNHFLQIAAVSQGAGKKDIAAEALVKACQVPLGGLPDSRQIGWVIQYLLDNDRAEDLLRVTERMLETEKHPSLLNNAVYLSLIFSGGESLDERMMATAEEVLATGDTHPEYRSTLALVRCLDGRPGEAMQAYGKPGESTKVDWQQFRPSGRATYALVLAKNGKAPPFEAVVSGIVWEEMTSAERLFFKEQLTPFLPQPAGVE